MRSLQSYFGNHDELFSFYDIVIGFFVHLILFFRILTSDFMLFSGDWEMNFFRIFPADELCRREF